MAGGFNRFPAWFTIFGILHVSLALSSASSQPEGKVRSVHEIFRYRRQACADGTYEHEGRMCCLCAAGQRLIKHCSASPGDGQCEFCERGTYSSHPNSKETCEPCTSCSQENANLEEEESCTPARDRKCRCKEDHFCSSDTKICKICHPCKQCGWAGIKENCTPTSDTVCKDGSTEAGKIVGIILGVIALLFVIVVLAVFWWKKQWSNGQSALQQASDNADKAVEEIQLLKDVDLQPFLPDIAGVLGWKDMRDVARRSNMSEAIIESVQLDNQNESQEQTLQLLKKWVEMQGKGASNVLIKTLQKNGKRGKAEKIEGLLHPQEDKNVPV